MQEMEGCDTEEDIDVDGISTASDETQVSWDLRKQVTETVHMMMWQSVKKLIVFPFIQELEGCDAREELNMDGIPSDSHETVETQVNN